MVLSLFQEVEDYRYFDPKMLRMSDSNTLPRNKSPFNEVADFANILLFISSTALFLALSIIFLCSSCLAVTLHCTCKLCGFRGKLPDDYLISSRTLFVQFLSNVLFPSRQLSLWSVEETTLNMQIF